MRILLDECLAAQLVEQLRSRGHDVTRVETTLPALTDREVLDRAVSEKRVLVTLDKDFGEFSVREGIQHAGIVRLVDIPLRQQGERLNTVLAQHTESLTRGALITEEPLRTRVREPR